MEIRYSSQARKFIKKQDKPTRKRIVKAIESIPKGDIKSIIGSRNKYKRLRVGNFRIIFDDMGNIIDILTIDNRGEVYTKKHQKRGKK